MPEPIIEYASRSSRSPEREFDWREVWLFSPIFFEIGVFICCTLFIEPNPRLASFEAIIVLGSFLMSEAALIALLIIWHRKLRLIPMVMGWIFAGIGGLICIVILGMILGLMEP